MSHASRSVVVAVVGLAGLVGPFGPLLAPEAVAGVPASTTTTSTLPPGCGPDSASFTSIGCRLDDLAARVAASDDLGRFGTRLSKNLGRAEGLLGRAEDACGHNWKKSKRQMKRLVRVLVRAGRAITSLHARRNLDDELRRDLLGDVRTLVRDTKRLRRVLVCPPGSPSGAFV